MSTGSPGIEIAEVNTHSAEAISRELASRAQGVSLRAVSKRYGSVVAVENLTLDIPAHSYSCFLGPSGCGKTSTLRMVAGHEEVSSGEIWIGDRKVNHLPPAKRNTAMMFQSYALFPHKTVWENVDFGLKMRHVALAERRSRIGEILELVGLSHLADRKPHMLSGGQQQRVALARALVTRPQVLMLDEPLSALDETMRLRMRGELRKIQKQFGMTFIQVTHGVDEALSLSDQIVVMNQGRIEQVATPMDIFHRPASRFVAKFIGDNNIFEGKVLSSVPDTVGDLIHLEVAGVGSLFCLGDGVPAGTMAACSVRADLIQLEPYSPGAIAAPSPNPNRISARITGIEVTGYVTRVSLLTESTGQEVLYKARTEDWVNQGFQEGQLVLLSWSPQDCVFLRD